MKIGFIGCGEISYSHANVLKHEGHNIESVTYKENREGAEKFSRKYNIDKIYSNSDWRKMVSESDVDILWVVPSWDQIGLIFQDIVNTGIPAFFEKPLTLESEKIDNLTKNYSREYLSRYAVGYNRRFYSNIKYLKTKLKSEKIISVYANIPEPVNRSEIRKTKHAIIRNSTHVLDIISHCLEDYRFYELSKIKLNRKKVGKDYIASYKIKGIPVLIKSIWNAPEKFEVTFYTESDRAYRLSPLEKLTILEGLEIHGPTKNKPIRTYEPRVSETHIVSDSDFKPGFKDQAKYFIARIQNNGKISKNYFDNIKKITLLCNKISFEK